MLRRCLKGKLSFPVWMLYKTSTARKNETFISVLLHFSIQWLTRGPAIAIRQAPDLLSETPGDLCSSIIIQLQASPFP
jgi:hypothetical protein